jgi:hypothetical protein
MAPHLCSMVLSRIFFVLQLVVLILVWQLIRTMGFAADLSNLSATMDVAGPARFTGTIYEIGSQRKAILYHFERTASRAGATVQVQRQFTSPDGSPVAVESVFYVSNRLVSYQMKELQANLSGSVQIEPDPTKRGQQKIIIGYGKGLIPTKSDPQPLKPDTLIDDNLYPFMLFHWDELMRGQEVKFRFVSIEWRHTFNFRLLKTGETIVKGRTCELICMKPTGFMLQQVVNPLVFTVEKAAPHLMLSYIGRTTPRVKKGDSWKYLDAETVFDLDDVVPEK